MSGWPEGVLVLLAGVAGFAIALQGGIIAAMVGVGVFLLVLWFAVTR